MTKGMITVAALLLMAGVVYWLIIEGTETEALPARPGGEVAQAEKAKTPAVVDTAVTSEPTMAAQHEGEVTDRLPEGDHALLEAYRERGCVDDRLRLVNQMPPSERRELEAWLESQGHFGGLEMNANMGRPIAPFDDYSSYETEGLRQLASQHSDTKAQLALAMRLGEENELEESMHWLRETIIGGYTMPIIVKGVQKQFQGMMEVLGADLEEEELQAKMMESTHETMAFMQFAKIRGAPVAEPMMKAIAELPNAIADANNQEIEELDWEAIHARGEALYESFQDERMSRGLPPFDNQRPAVADVLDRDAFIIFEAGTEGLRPCGS